ncbi:MAG: FemAB family PEP-CTERM system-associated protein [Phycisphaerales bacterium]|nr:MAG: FemAB family PEP-CTERM system-associated protein [Phycisphaerales bacterium]
MAGHEDADRWDAYVKRHPEGTFFHTWAWRRAVAETFGHQPFYFAAFQGERIVGVLPLFLVRTPLAGRLLVSVPYAVYGGAVVEFQEAAALLLGAMKELAAEHGVRQVDLRSVRPLWPELTTVEDRYVAFQKPLPLAEADVLAALPRKARAAARNARDKHKLTVEFADANLRQVWELYARSMRRLGSPNYPYGFFERLIRGTPARHVVSLVRHEGRPAAGLVSFIHNDTLMPYFAGCDERLERCSPNNFLYLTAMEWGVRAGLRRFDFGRSRVGNHGSFDFKRHQGFQPVPLRYQVWVRPGAQAADLTPDSSRLQWAIRTWRRLPLLITRPLGAWLAGWVPG